MTAAELEAILRTVQPAVCVVKRRHLRKFLQAAAEDGEPVLRVPGPAAWVDAGRVRKFDKYSRSAEAVAGEQILLVPDPDDLFTKRTTQERELWQYWRLLVRAAVVAELQRRFLTGGLAEAELRERFNQLGATAETELRFVLQSDHETAEHDDDLAVYRTFAAAFLDLHQFRPHAIPWVFPTLANSSEAFATLAQDVPIAEIVARSRPAGAADREPQDVTPQPVGATEAVIDRARIDRSAKLGNHVRAAVLQVRSGSADGVRSARITLRDGLIQRLKRALGWSGSAANEWAAALDPLIPLLGKRAWPRAARCLYELQKIPVDLEGEISVVDPIEWVTSFGRRPLKRTLTGARTVILFRHLSRAHDHLIRTPLSAADRDRLEKLLNGELHRAEERLRDELAPVIRAAFDGVGFVPQNRVETVAREKVIAELLDRLAERGFLRFGDLRDAVARNQHKLPDLSPMEWLTGDQLLQVDRRLSVALDGVYRRGEVYLRLIHRGTAAGFGTKVGRFLAQYVVFPFLGAFLTVEFGKFLSHELAQLYGFLRRQMPQKEPDEAALIDDWVDAPDVTPAAAPAPDHGIALTPNTVVAIAIIGLVYLALMHSPAFRGWVWLGLRYVGRVLHWLVATAPLAVWDSAPVRLIRKNPVLRVLNRLFGTAFATAILVAVISTLFAASMPQTLQAAGVAFVVVFLVTVTPGGRQFEDELYEYLSDTWRVFRVNLIPGLISWIAWAFRSLAGAVERGLYSIDELFRFRDCQSRGSYGLKVVLAVVWFPVAYAFRFVFYLLVEPQVNPVKHFPIVTVSHKVIWPLLPELASVTGSEWTAAAVINGIPGIFGFIAWELKEDWRLFEANRSTSLPQVVLGHHGETMRGLLRPGFHSGTVPSLYRKLRTALVKAELSGKPVSALKPLEGLHQVRHAIESFVNRELLPLVNESSAWEGATLHCHAVLIGVQSIQITLQGEDANGPLLPVAFERQDDAIQFRVHDRVVWREQRSPEQSAVLGMALAGFAEMGCANEDGPRIPWAEWAKYWGQSSPPLRGGA